MRALGGFRVHVFILYESLINIANIISTSFFSVFLVISHAQIKKQSNVSAAGSSCFAFAISCDLYGIFDLSLFPWDLDQFP